MLTRKNWRILLLAWLLKHCAPLKIGDNCVEKYRGEHGICTTIKDCPQAAEMAKTGIPPTICEFQSGVRPIVCCEVMATTEQVSLKNPEPHSERALKTKVTSLDEYQRISEEKCQRYVSAVRKLVTDIQPLIVGGTEVSPKDFPFMVSIGYGWDDWTCGGTIVSEHFVMTAAHCVFYKVPMMVRTASTLIEIFVEQAIVHPDYRFPGKYNDIALLKLKRKFAFSHTVAPACLYWKESLDVKEVVAAGWGMTEHGRLSRMLRKVHLDVMDNSVCNLTFAEPKELPFGIADTMMCVGHLQGGKDTCQGDSGGPILIPNKQKRYLYVVGITSFGDVKCGQKNSPAVYTKVSKFLPWIVRNIWN